jgi:lysophospholipase L1-like esterase
MKKLQPGMIIPFLLLLAFSLPEKNKLTIWMIGDSTMAVKETKAYPETGWGMPFVYFFDSTVKVENRAKNGRSTKTFLSENLWAPIEAALQPGDYVFIQFGHNDESKEKTERYTSPEDYRINILRFINETRAKNAIPVLLTPVTRRKFDKEGKIMETHELYSKVVREIAAETKVAFIDMDRLSQEFLQQWGVENSKLLFLQLEPGEHPNYPDGKIDNTHFTELGARKMAQLVLKEMKRIELPLTERIIKPIVKK